MSEYKKGVIAWIAVLLFVAGFLLYSRIFHCSYGWDVEQMRIACKGEGE